MREVTVVDDDLDEISTAIREILRRRPAYLFVVGGLGPTPDDMTLKGIARGLHLRMRTDGRALSMIRDHYSTRGLGSVEITPARKKMAVLPEGAEPVQNDAGTAPAVRLMHGRTVIFSLPGVPEEMKSIFRRRVEPEVQRAIGPLSRRTYRLKLEGIMESSLAPLISKSMKASPGAYIKSHPRGVENGVSKLEVDVAVVDADSKAADREARRIADSIAKASAEAGATVRAGPELRR